MSPVAQPLTVHNAEIRTATVEIRTLTITGKQVTLAVFRQLRDQQLVAEDGTFNGIPWGTVNYHPDKCADDSAHVHVVWQQGTDLRRSAVREPRCSTTHAGVGDARRWLDAAVLDGWRASGERPTAGYRELYSHTFYVTFDVGTLVVDADEYVLDAIWPTAYVYPEDPQKLQARRQKCRDEALEKIRKRAAGCGTCADLRARVECSLADTLATAQRHHDRWKEINDLPQLFIAV